MTRLIDANDLIKAILDFPNCENGYSDAYDKEFIVCEIEEQPTVDAIPVEWIEEYMNNHMFKFSDRWMAMDWMLNDWRKENGQTD